MLLSSLLYLKLQGNHARVKHCPLKDCIHFQEAHLEEPLIVACHHRKHPPDMQKSYRTSTTSRQRYAALAGWPMTKHDVAGQLHVPMVLGEFFVTLEQEVSLRPFLMLRADRRRER